MKNQILKLSLLAFFSFFIFSCEKDSIEENKTGQSENCPEVALNIKERKGFDITVYAKQIEGATYKWTVEKDGKIEEASGDKESPYTLSWGPSAGITTFCVSIATESCSGEKYCTTFTATEAQFEEGNKDGGKISVIKNENNVFTYKIEGKDTLTKNCKLDATMVINYRKSNVIDPEIIGLEKIEGVVYEWSVNGELHGIGSNELGWSPPPGINEFCVKITTPDCKEGITICEKINFSEDDDNKGIEIGKEKVRIQKNKEGVFVFSFPKETSETPKNKDCKEINFTIMPGKGLDVIIEAPTAPLNEGFTYSWKVTTTYLDDRDQLISEDVAGSDNIYSWGSSEGINEFCLTVTSKNCPEGITTCKKLAIPKGFSQESQDNIGTKIIQIRELPSGNYIAELVNRI